MTSQRKTYHLPFTKRICNFFTLDNTTFDKWRVGWNLSPPFTLFLTLFLASAPSYHLFHLFFEPPFGEKYKANPREEKKEKGKLT